MWSGVKLYLSRNLQISEDAKIRELAHTNGAQISDDSTSAIFVINNFESDEFKELWERFDNQKKELPPVLGVRCIIECNEANKPLPKRSELPVSHLGFDGVTVYVPKREPAKVLHSPKGLFQLFSKSYSAEERIALATSMMGGQIASQGRRPTHVVCSDAKHPKYKDAKSKGYKVVTPEWVWQSWFNQKRLDESKFLCSVFTGLAFSITGTESKTRELLAMKIKAHGGHYLSSMVPNEVTHLIVDPEKTLTTKGSKYYWARRSKIHTVSEAWVSTAIENDECPPESEFFVDLPLDEGDGSASAGTENSGPPEENKYLDGCKICLLGMDETAKHMYINTILKAGGVRYEKADRITHVVIGDLNSALDLLRSILKGGRSNPYVVKLGWLDQCIIRKERLPPELFLIDTASLFNASEPLVQGTFGTKNSSETSVLKTRSSQSRMELDLVPKNRTGADSPSGGGLKRSRSPSQDPAGQASRKRPKTTDVIYSQVDEYQKELSSSPVSKKEVFKNVKFLCVGFPTKSRSEIANRIKQNGGTCFLPEDLAENKSEFIQYIIAPHGFPQESLQQLPVWEIQKPPLVTTQWIEACTKEKTLVDASEYLIYTPLPFSSQQYKKFMKDFVITTSDFNDKDTSYLTRLSVLLGAKFSMKLISDKTTHLICDLPNSEKFKNAVSNGIKIVSRSWIEACAKLGYCAREEEFSLFSGKSAQSIPKLKVKEDSCGALTGFPSVEDHVMNDLVRTDKPVLRGCTIYCTSSVSAQTSEIRELAHKLGAEHSWEFNDQVTHVIHSEEGKCDVNRQSREVLKKAKERGLRVVSPQWIRSCNEAGVRQLEKIYSAALNTRKGLIEVCSPPPGIPSKISRVSRESSKSRRGRKQTKTKKKTPTQLSQGGLLSQIECPNFYSNRGDNPLSFTIKPEPGTKVSKPKPIRQTPSSNNQFPDSGFDIDNFPVIESAKPHDILFQDRKPRKSDVLKTNGHTFDDGTLLHLLQPKEDPTQDPFPNFDHVDMVAAANPPKIKTVKQENNESASTDHATLNSERSAKQNISSDGQKDGATSDDSDTNQEETDPSKDMLSGTQEQSQRPDPQMVQHEDEMIGEFSELVSNYFKNSSTTTAGQTTLENDSSTIGSTLQLDTVSLGMNSNTDFGAADFLPESRDRKSLGNTLGNDSHLQEFEEQESQRVTYGNRDEDEERNKLLEKIRAQRKGREAEEDPDEEELDRTEIDRFTEMLKPGRSGKSQVRSSAKKKTQTQAAKKQQKPTSQMKKVYRFLASGFNKKKDEITSTIADLGGTVSWERSFDPTCTHLLVKEPLRSEKYLSACASGKWVLSKSYLEASVKAGKFVHEKDHELTAEGIDQADKRANAEAPRRWRETIERQGGRGSFNGWKVILYVTPNREPGLENVLLAGGATIVTKTPPFSNLQDIKFAFVDPVKARTHADDLKSLIDAQIPCLKPDFLSDYLLKLFSIPDDLSAYQV